MKRKNDKHLPNPEGLHVYRTLMNERKTTPEESKPSLDKKTL
jgi:hypothetical protein